MAPIDSPLKPPKCNTFGTILRPSPPRVLVSTANGSLTCKSNPRVCRIRLRTSYTRVPCSPFFARALGAQWGEQQPCRPLEHKFAFRRWLWQRLEAPSDAAPTHACIQSNHTYLKQPESDQIAAWASGGAGLFTDEILQTVRDPTSLSAQR